MSGAKKTYTLLHKRRYEILLGALILHLFTGVFLTSAQFYVRYIWPFNVLILGIASVGVFLETNTWRKRFKNLLFVAIVILPFLGVFLDHMETFMIVFSFLYGAFFLIIFSEVFKFLIRPSYINFDLLSAAACGYFLLLEMLVFLLMAINFISPDSFVGVNHTNVITVFMDLVYFSSISMTSIGFGDITPATTHTKLLISFFGIISQFYMVVLIGLLIGKFSSNRSK